MHKLPYKVHFDFVHFDKYITLFFCWSDDKVHSKYIEKYEKTFSHCHKVIYFFKMSNMTMCEVLHLYAVIHIFNVLLM